MTEESREGGGSPDSEMPAHKAFQGQRIQIKTLEEQVEDLQGRLDEKEPGGDEGTAKLRREMRSMQRQIDSMSMQGLSDEAVEMALASDPWLKGIPDKTERIAATKRIIALSQGAGKNAGDPPVKGRSKSEAATRAHLTGGGPPASGASNRSDAEVEKAKYDKDMSEAKTQSERDKIVQDWSNKHPDDQQL